MKKSLVSLTAAACFPLLAACGGSSSEEPKASPDSVEAFQEGEAVDIANEAVSAMDELQSAEVGATASADGTDTTIRVTLDRDGKCEGNVASSERGTAELVSEGDKLYVRGDTDFWVSVAGNAKAGNAIASEVLGNWTIAPPNTVQNFCDLTALTETFAYLGDADTSTFSTNGAVEYNGVPAVEIGTADGELVVAAEEPHYVLSSRDASGAVISFSKFDEDFSVEAPAPDEITKLSSTNLPR